MTDSTSTLKKIVDLLIDIIYKTHTYFLSMNDSFEAQLSDKQLHFLIIGLLGIGMLLVIYPLFKWMAKKNLTVLISWFYVFTVLVVITFAIEIGNGIRIQAKWTSTIFWQVWSAILRCPLYSCLWLRLSN